jgi:carbamoyl-phosphate synthase large subunit
LVLKHRKPQRILTEASGSRTSAYLIKAIQDAGHFAIGSDIDSDCFGRFIADDFIVVPRHGDDGLWTVMKKGLVEKQIDVVIPSFDETLLGWAERCETLQRAGTTVVVSPPDAVSIFVDKWRSYQFFRDISVPTVSTSLNQEYPLVKPRFGRGGSGVKITDEPVSMDGMISQEIAVGREFTVDVLCSPKSDPIYIVPRFRETVVGGKSLDGQVFYAPKIDKYVRRICIESKLEGPVNIQGFLGNDESLLFVEVNPRIAGGMALGFAATENWINPIVEMFIHGTQWKPKPVEYGLKMKRYYAEVFVS